MNEKKVLSAEKIAELRTPNPRFKYTTAIHVVIADVLDSHEELRRQLDWATALLDGGKVEDEALRSGYTKLAKQRDSARAWSRRWKAAAKHKSASWRIHRSLIQSRDDAKAKLQAAESRLAIAVEAIQAAQSAFSEDRVREEALDYNAFHIFCDKAAEALAAIEKGTK